MEIKYKDMTPEQKKEANKIKNSFYKIINLATK